MNKEKLATAIRELALVVRKTEVPGDEDLQQDYYDAADLLKVLSQIVAGQPMEKAFGSPGDWGYGTPVGDALAGR